MGKLLGLILRFLFSWIDGITVRLITTIYRLFSDMTELVVYNDSIIKTIGKRIGLILGIFMLFKLAISLISYMISPDKLSDGKQGGGKLIINVGISLALLISINFIFKEAYFVQGKLVESRIIEKIFFGESGVILESNSENISGSQKMDIGYYLYTGFFNPNTDVFDVTCNDMWDVSKKISDECNSLLEEKFDNEEVNEIYRARNSLDMSYVFFNQGLVLAQPDNDYTYAFDYTPIISNAAGIIVLLVLISFSMDLATRAIKLFFLQVIAPIPIISNMDMGKGQDIFKKWGKECINTYLQVFMRLIAINFAVFMIVLLRGNFKDVFVNNIWLNIFLIIGCLMFAKQVPKLLEDFFGIKSDGMTLNPLKKFEEQAMFGKNITGLAAGAVVGAIGAPHTGLLNPLKGAWSGMTGGKGFKESWSSQASRNATMRTARLNGSTLPGRIGAKLGETFGTGGELAQLEREKHYVQDQLDDIDRDIKIQEDQKAHIKGTQQYRQRQQDTQNQNNVVSAANKFKERAISQVDTGNGAAGQRYQEMKRIAKGISGSTDETGAVMFNGRSYSWRNSTERGQIAEQIAQEAETYKNTRGWRDYADEVADIDDTRNALYDAKLRNARNEFDNAFGVVGGHIDHDLVAQGQSYGDALNEALNTSINEVSRLQVDGSADERAIGDIDRVISDLQGQKQPLNDQMRDISRRESIANANKSVLGK